MSALLGGIFAAFPLSAAEEGPWTDRFFRETEEIKARLAAIEGQQKEILANQEETFKRLDQLRIWVHRK